MTYDLLRRAATAMRREHTPFLDAVAALFDNQASVIEEFGTVEETDDLFEAAATAYLADPGPLPEAFTTETP